MTAGRSLIALLAALLCAGLPAEAQQARLLHEEPGALVPLRTERSLELSGIRGQVALRAGKPGELRYETRAADDHSAERPIALWERPGALELRPPEGREDEPLYLEIAVPPELAVDARLDGARVEIAGLLSRLRISGGQLQIDARGLRESAVLDLHDSDLTLNGADRDLTVSGRSLRATLVSLSGPLEIDAGESVIAVKSARAAVGIDVEETRLTIEGAQQGLRVRALGGLVAASDVRGPAELALEGATLELSAIHGPARVESDSDVVFHDVEGRLVVESFGGAVRGKGARGPVEVAAERAAVILESIGGAVTVRGDELQVLLSDIQDEARVVATRSSIQVQSVLGLLDVETDLGDVRVAGAEGAVRVRSRGGNVVLEGVKGPVDVQADGERVDVSWSELAGTTDQTVDNAGGDVVASFPARAVCRVEAEASYGRVESSLPTVLVGEDRRFASGVLGGADRPLVKLHSSRDLLIRGQGAQ